tara:strand:- start:560 stop:808 length:249 start_codon:yes stop_codon:yes gene_type:complete
MVGLKNMGSNKPACAFCKGSKTSVTICDKTNKPLCSKCATVVPVHSSVSESLIQVMAKQHAPKKHIAKLQERAIERGEKFEF